ncbi:MAG: hypothetical protein GTN62_07685 [Gemmatimonadales bacterium]|nr:hypothetical protein [Gemmatimonadales bacterium]NIN11373.1 hypothetical protein [Gemmatimonadales bacterium]NIN49982.1 hypothetical protein [Gemmatimonadales bacterium]NIP07446.1 hypothetical protein [Gemmatimonadales bacterium]NIR00514.1 hypothetical protein [Gemmatimonadales bacterium]
MPRRAIAVVVLFAFMAQLTGCYKQSTLQIPPDHPRARYDPIVGIVTRQGEHVRFDPPAAVVDGRVVGQADGTLYEFDLSEVERLWVERRTLDGGRTATAVVAVVGVAVGVALLLGAFDSGDQAPRAPAPAPEAESCPFVYSWDGGRYVFDAEPYGGAISRGLERDDYAELEHLRPVDGLYRLMVRNELAETQHTNLIELWVADHRPGVSIAADALGGLHTLRSPEPPLAARDSHDRDLLPWLRADDQLIWEPAPVASDYPSLRQEIVITFAKPPGAERVKLVARVATGFWGSHMIREMLELRGRGLAQWYATIDKETSEAEALYRWIIREELYALQIAVEEPSGWVVRGLLPGGGPFVSEDRVVVLDVSRVPGDRLRVRVRPPLGFWALNSFALDATPDEEVLVTRLAPLEARGADGSDLRSVLSRADDSYHVMPTIGDAAHLTFAAPAPVPSMERTVFLHSSGWYRIHLKARGEPDLAALGQIFDVPGGAARLAAERYAEWHRSRLPS